MKLVYVIGYPGAGKTTLVTAALALLPEGIAESKPVPHVRHGDVWHLGLHRPVFGGTDTLSMSIQPQAIEWLRELADADEPRVMVGEGDRLATHTFLSRTHAIGHKVVVINLAVSPAEARRRAQARALATDRAPQSETWWKGRVTKVDRLTYSRLTRTYDGSAPVAELAADLFDELSR